MLTSRHDSSVAVALKREGGLGRGGVKEEGQGRKTDGQRERKQKKKKKRNKKKKKRQRMTN